jgi:glycosyltransferase involved in cell wall biosynthesis
MLIYGKDATIFKACFLQFFQRRGIRNVQEIWTQPFFPFVNALSELKINSQKIKNTYFPVIVDTLLFVQDKSAYQSADKNVRKILDNFKFVIFHPSRIMINAHPKLRNAGQWKQNDLLFQAFKHFLLTSGAKDAVLVMPDRIFSNDIAIAKYMIRELDLDKNVLWIKADSELGYTKNELIKFYSIADVVADDFGIGWFGSVVLEGFSIGKPVLSYVDEEAMNKLYPWHPFLSSNTKEGISEFISKLYFDPEFKKKQGELGRKWIEEFHAEDKASKIYVNHFLNMLGQNKK